MGNTWVIKNATVIDPVQNGNEKRDLYVVDGSFVAQKPDENDPQVSVFNAEGCYAVPSFVDMHVHVFQDHARISVQADQIGVRQGVGTVVDAGSTGIRDYPAFEKVAIRNNSTDVRFFLNIARSGLCDDLAELGDMDGLMTAEELVGFQKEHGAQMVGLKVRMSSSVVKENGIKPLQWARELADKADLPIMVHIGNAPPDLGPVLDLMRKGDIITHCFHGKVGGTAYFAEQYKAAIARGVHFDVGHGNASFSYETAPQVLKIAQMDFSISTDLYGSNTISPVGSLMDTMTKFLPLGFEVEDLVRKASVLPRQVLRMPKASFAAGMPADITFFKMQAGKRVLIDSEGYQIPVDRYFRPIATFQKGERVWHVEP